MEIEIKPEIFKDLNGNPVHEGDAVTLYAIKHELTQTEPGIYECGPSKGILDVPLATGFVQWNPDFVAYMIFYTWKCEQWQNGSVSAQIDRNSYAYELVNTNTSVDQSGSL